MSRRLIEKQVSVECIQCGYEFKTDNNSSDAECPECGYFFEISDAPVKDKEEPLNGKTSEDVKNLVRLFLCNRHNFSKDIEITVDRMYDEFEVEIGGLSEDEATVFNSLDDDNWINWAGRSWASFWIVPYSQEPYSPRNKYTVNFKG